MVVCGFVNTATVTTSLRTFTAAADASTMELTSGLLHHDRGNVNDELYISRSLHTRMTLYNIIYIS